jgi:S-formylglutathione hydrolase FrmB
MRRPPSCGVLAALALLAAGSPASAEVRPGRFASRALGRDVAYTLQLPPSYAAGSRAYPVVYALHGLFESHLFWERRGLAAEVDRLQATGALPEIVIVAVDGGNSFFVNSPMGAYEDLVTRDLVEHVESTYRVLHGRGGRGLLGVSMGGYAALRIAFEHPEAFAAVATHSAMLLADPPRAGSGADPWQLAAFARVFGDPLDEARWRAADPLTWARTAPPGPLPAVYFDCGAEDRYGLAEGHRALDRLLAGRGIPHAFTLRPGDHGYEFVRSALPFSLTFLSEHLARR